MDSTLAELTAELLKTLAEKRALLAELNSQQKELLALTEQELDQD